mmetsp:Transcript_34034/g.95800  ORF Transcript_34034/g.95800 Transcript_34034/m.95800 type:complete len:342 (+) Transcript_34034:92-1117(+)
MEGKGVVVLVVVGLMVVGMACAAEVRTAVVYGGRCDTEAENVKEFLDQTGLLGDVDVFPTTALDNSGLLTYDALLVFNNIYTVCSPFDQDDADILSQAVDKGIGVVVASKLFGDTSNIDPLKWSEAYNVLNADGGYPSLTPLTLVKLEEDHPIFRGVESFSGGRDSPRNDDPSLHQGTVIGEWSDGTNLIAVYENKTGGWRRVDVNVFPVSSDMYPDNWDVTTDGAVLFANSLLWAANQTVPDKDCVDASSCSDCVGGDKAGNCLWCSAEAECVTMPNARRDSYCRSHIGEAQYCPVCAQYADCSSCAAQVECIWCLSRSSCLENSSFDSCLSTVADHGSC